MSWSCPTYVSEQQLEKMKLFSLILILIHQVSTATAEDSSNFSLTLVQVLFRHGARTPDEIEYNTYKYIDASLYEPYEFGDLTKTGEQQEYEIGVMLRELYNNFLSINYDSKDIYADASDKDRTKMSLQMVLAGLYPPTSFSSWSPDVNWIPIPYNYIPHQFDVLLRPYQSSKYQNRLQESLESTSFRQRASVYQDFIDFLNNKTGNSFDPSDIEAMYLYDLLTCNEYLHLPLPKWYTPEVKRQFQDYMAFAWNGTVSTEELKRLLGGPLVRTFIENMNLNDSVYNPRKMYLYSGHDINLVGVSSAIGVDFGDPSFGSALIVETLRDYENRLYIRLLSWKRSEGLKTLNLENCQELCPIEDFLKSVQNVIPSDEEMNYLLEDLNLDPESIATIENIYLQDPIVTTT